MSLSGYDLSVTGHLCSVIAAALYRRLPGFTGTLCSVIVTDVFLVSMVGYVL